MSFRDFLEAVEQKVKYVNFSREERARVAIRFDLNPPSRQHVEHLLSPVTGHAHVRFDLISLPLYAVGELGRLLDALRTEKKGTPSAQIP